MKKISTLMVLLSTFFCVNSYAQRYLEEVFDEVTVTSDITYGVNASILYYSVYNEAIPEELKLDLYEPTGDIETARPLILCFHTGNALPFPQNQSPTGTRADSTLVEFARRFARMGYVVASCDYRLGWNPYADDQPTRVETLINAAYRGVQDSRTAVRFFRKSADIGGNPYKIDPTKIVVFGEGTGGYIALSSGTIDSYSDIVLPKFTKQVEVPPGSGNFVPIPMVIESVHGNIYGTSVGVNPVDINNPNDDDTLCYINHPGYSSDFNLAINLGGACGDLSWIDDNDCPIISFQVPTDPFAPYTTGTVIVPVLNLPVVEVSGSYDVQEALAAFDNNEVFELAESYGPGASFTSAANLHNDGLYGLFPFVRPTGFEADSSPWQWWAPDNPNNTNGLATNPDMSEMKAKAYIDSIQFYAAPRMACVLNLPGSPCFVGISENEEVAFNVYPNPAKDQFTIRSLESIQCITVTDLLGKVVLSKNNINSELFSVPADRLSVGVYNVMVFSENGTGVRRLILE
ncbi:MAG: T9SS type A sorting domain-containing protein [Crocinitomicaceae bacterium]|nr:T9SS type A sorting domain-containing protein [Crocinitomicaceae bacterium]